jgi:predicted aminopeptidase
LPRLGRTAALIANLVTGLAMSLTMSLGLTACGDATPGYVLHLAQGQMQVLLDSQPIQQVRAQTTDPARLAQLDWVDSVRAYAGEIGLRGAHTNYSRFYDTGAHPISYNVSASPVDELSPFQWKFPFLGALPYKGYFDRQRAVDEAQRLTELGYDALARPVAAYSTLGYLPDPLLSSMLDDGEARLADLLLHELTHVTIFADGQVDYNESTASFVGRQGALDMMRRRYGANAAQVDSIRIRREDSTNFTEFIGTLLDQLDSLYAQDLKRDEILTSRDQLLRAAQERYRQHPQLAGSRYDGFLRWERVNNARLLSYRRYNRDLHLFTAVHDAQRADLKASLPIFAHCAEQTDPWDCLEQAGR